MRPVYPTAVALDEMPEYNALISPRLCAPERAVAYDHPGVPHTKPLGYIPEVAHTYAYIDSDYGVMNEHGLMLGECTDDSTLKSEAPYQEGSGIFYASELGRVALERCHTAREAINLMGELIDRYGIWGTGETLLVADKDEGWVLEMQPTANQQGGFWIAQRVPDGEFFVAANQFRIRAILPNNPDQIYNPELPQKLKDAGWAAYDKAGHLDWVKSVQGVESFHPYYSMRRVWRAMSLVAPSQKLPAKAKGYDNEPYPFSIRPDKPLTVTDIMALHRDAYEGTVFSRSDQAGAGLFGSPYRYGKTGDWERSIAHKNTAYTWITQTNGSLPAPVYWLSMNTAPESYFVPLTVSPLPEVYGVVDRYKYDPDKVWWTTSAVSALTRGYYSVLDPIVRGEALSIEKKSLELTADSRSQTPEQFTSALNENAVQAAQKWQKLYGELLVKIDGGSGLDYAQTPKIDAPRKY